MKVKERLNVHRSIRTFSGKYINVFEPDLDLIDINDIAHALSHMPRFGGHTKQFHSVAEHSVWVSDKCSKPHKLAGLLHDATEAYLVDIPKPIKVELTQYVRLENRLMKAIAKKFGFAYPLSDEVKRVDYLGLEYEWKNKVLANKFPSLSSAEAKLLFLNKFKELTK